MATMYLVRDVKHRRLVALKALRPAVGSSVGTDRFLREIELAAGLQHPDGGLRSKPAAGDPYETK